MDSVLPARYLAYCPNCGGPITEERLEQGLACERCQPDPAARPAGFPRSPKPSAS